MRRNKLPKSLLLIGLGIVLLVGIAAAIVTHNVHHDPIFPLKEYANGNVQPSSQDFSMEGIVENEILPMAGNKAGCYSLHEDSGTIRVPIFFPQKPSFGDLFKGQHIRIRLHVASGGQLVATSVEKL